MASFDGLPAQADGSLHQLLPLRPGSSPPSAAHGPLGLQKSCLQQKRRLHTHLNFASGILGKACKTFDGGGKKKSGKGRRNVPRVTTTNVQTDYAFETIQVLKMSQKRVTCSTAD